MAEGFRLSERAARKTRETTEIVLGQGPAGSRRRRQHGGAPLGIFVGKTAADINKGNSGTVSIYRGSTIGAEVDTGETVTCYNRFMNLKAGTWVICWTHGESADILAGLNTSAAIEVPFVQDVTCDANGLHVTTAVMRFTADGRFIEVV